jgi:hypothetical protein
MVDVLWREGNPQAAIRLEEMWNDLGRSHSFTLLCAYVMGNFFKERHGEQFRRVCETHSHVIPAETWSSSDDPEIQLREVSILQQRARALQAEVKQRQELEEAPAWRICWCRASPTAARWRWPATRPCPRGQWWRADSRPARAPARPSPASCAAADR